MQKRSQVFTRSCYPILISTAAFLPTPQVQVLEIEDEVIALHKRLPEEQL
ncbi:hypothetical protein [Chroococcidiopsis sp. CCMEE 29]|nr:hypothetical protein [Chroococcidiopsis sp. CCMEE 29]